MCLSFYLFPILLFYIISLIFTTLNRKFITYKGIFVLFSIFLIFFLFFLIISFNEFLFFSSISIIKIPLSTINWLSLDISLILKFDFLSISFVLLVIVIGLATNFYAGNYLKYEAHEDIFALLINWFIFSMVFLVLSNNLFSLFLGWESIGLSSFFLINFWNTRRGTLKSSFKAFFFNKISDVFLFLFIILINYITYSNDLTLINFKLSNITTNINSLIYISILSLLCCSFFKSAQLVGHLWLPDSMEAPVPASALIHSATLVSAGIYLNLRFGPIIKFNNLENFLLIIGALTAAYGGIVSSSQTDMKKLLAYSTISHCGFLFVTIGTQVHISSIIYLFMHGLFKASTFFCAGSFIRVAGSQDTRNMGNLSRLLPVDTAFLIICSFNLAGLPFSFGYLYKAILLNSLLLSINYYLVIGFCIIGLLCSIIYSYRLVYYSCFDTSKEFFLNIVYELQQKQINIVDYWSLTTIIQIIAVTIIFCFSVYIYIYFTNFFLYSELTICHYPLNLDFSSIFFYNSNNLYKNYYEIFYSIYLLVLSILLIVTWRVEFTYNYKLNFYSFLINSFFFSIFFNLF